MFLWRFEENYPLIIIKYPPDLFLCEYSQLSNIPGLVAKQSIKYCQAVNAAIFISGTADLNPSSIIGNIVLVKVPR